MNIPPFPLSWPKIQTKTKEPLKSPKNRVTLAAAIKNLQNQIMLIDGVTRVVISSNAKLKKDGLPYSTQLKGAPQGVAVWVAVINKPFWLCMAYDRYDSIAANLGQIVLSIKDIRAFCGRMNREPVSVLIQNFQVDQAYVKDPEPEPKQEKKREAPRHKKPNWDPEDWRSVLQMPRVLTFAAAQANYKRLAKIRHPDKKTGSTEAFQKLENAYEQAKKYFKFKTD